MTTDNDDAHRRALLAAHLRRMLAIDEQLAQRPDAVTLALQREHAATEINTLAAALGLGALPAGLAAIAGAAGLREQVSASLQRQHQHLSAYRRAVELQLAMASPSAQVTLTMALQQVNERLEEIGRQQEAVHAALLPLEHFKEPAMSDMTLSAEQHRRLRALLMRCDELTSNADLSALFVDQRLKPWRTGVREANNLRARVDLLIDYLRDQRNTARQTGLVLLLWVLTERYEQDDERHDNLLALASELAYGLRVILPPNSPNDPQLERKIRASNAMLDIHGWLTKLAALKDQVCRVAISFDGRVAYGTGFLVAPDLVLTNYHVVESVITGKAPPAGVSLLFDYHLKEDGVTPHVGKRYPLVAQDWLIDASPYSPLDLQVAAGVDPDLEHLDYALLRIDGAPGHALVDRLVGAGVQSVKRGWLQLAATQAAFVTNSPLLIVQHPDGKELKLAIDTDAIIGVNSNGTRVRYRTNTEPGSSGSPCFDANWNLIALHHSGDPNSASLHHSEYNQGIPIAAILRLLEQRGKRAVLDAA